MNMLYVYYEYVLYVYYDYQDYYYYKNVVLSIPENVLQLWN